MRVTGLPLLFLGLTWILTVAAATEGEKAPSFTLPSPSKQVVSLNAYLGRKPVLLLFFRHFG